MIMRFLSFVCLCAVLNSSFFMCWSILASLEWKQFHDGIWSFLMHWRFRFASILLRIFVSVFIREIVLRYFFCCVLVWFWCQGTFAFIEWIWKHSFPFYFYGLVWGALIIAL
jgi:hypothetical protein